MKPKVLVSAFAVSPLLGSEPGLGWNYCSRLGAFCNATVLYGFEKSTFERDFSIEGYLTKNGISGNVNFIWVEAPKLAKYFYKIHKKTTISLFYYWAYNLWQKVAFKKAKELDAKINFDIIHQFNMIGFREPGYLWKLNKPFIWGPVGGTVNINRRYFKLFGLKGAISNYIRNFANQIQLNFSDRVNQAGLKSKLIIAASTSERINLQKKFPNKVIRVINDSGIRSISPTIKKIKTGPLKIIWSGTHTPGKALPFLLHALKLCKQEFEFQLTILGQGAETERWKNTANELGLNENIIWLGWVKRQDALNYMSNSDFTVFTSLKEGTPHVVLESLSLGLPVITIDKCGMGDVINESCGIKIKEDTVEKMISEFYSAIKFLNSNPVKLMELSKGAVERAKEYSWDEFTIKITNLYNQFI